MWKIAGLAGLCLASAGAALGQTSGAPPSQITQPKWLRLPSAEDLAKFYPPEAAKAGTSGSATIGCTVAADGTLANCTVVEETPAAMGFGEAALKMGTRIKMGRLSSDGKSTAGAAVRIPFVFRLPKPAATETAAAPLLDQPNWVRKPTGRDIARVYPPEAQRRSLNGGAVITCSVLADGRLTACQASDEQPPGMGFGEATLKLAPIFQMSPTTKDGRPVAGGTVRIPIIFRIF